MTGFTTYQAASSLPVDPADRDLYLVRLAWGFAYQIDYSEKHNEWSARHYSSGEQMIAHSLAEIKTLIREDYVENHKTEEGWGFSTR